MPKSYSDDRSQKVIPAIKLDYLKSNALSLKRQDKTGDFLAWLQVSTFLFLASLTLTTPTYAANPEHIKQLLETKQCKGCDLTNAKLKGASLEGANLEGANLEGVYLYKAYLVNANLSGANVRSADLGDVNMKGINLSGADLSKTNLKGNDMTGANLENANLSGAILKCNKITRTILTYANL
jgi:uncharacterized protein YjbI with pentapeptide repeats